MSFLSKLFGKREQPEPLAAQSELQMLRLALEEKEQTVARLKADLTRERERAEEQVASRVQAQTEALLADAAAPVSQLLTQAHLLEAEGKPVQARDVLAVAKRLVRELQAHGLTLEGEVGASTAFDPAGHTLLGGAVQPTPGSPVVVKFVGLSFHGKIIHKASVAIEKG